MDVLHCGGINKKSGKTAKDFMPMPVFILSIFLSGKCYGLITIMFALLLLAMVLFHFSDIVAFSFPPGLACFLVRQIISQHLPLTHRRPV